MQWQQKNHAREVDLPELFWKKLPRKHNRVGQLAIWKDARGTKK